MTKETFRGLVDQQVVRMIDELSMAETEIFEPLELWRTEALRLVLERYDREPMSLEQRSLVLAVEQELAYRDVPTAKLYAFPPDGAA